MCHHWGSDGHVPKYRTFFFYEKAGGYTKHCMQNITDTRNQEPPIQTGRGGAGRPPIVRYLNISLMYVAKFILLEFLFNNRTTEYWDITKLAEAGSRKSHAYILVVRSTALYFNSRGQRKTYRGFLKAG